MKETFVKFPLYWYEAGLKDMDDEEAGHLVDCVFQYAFKNIIPNFNKFTDNQMDLWKICKRDIDYQKTHPKSYRYPESEKTAIRRSGKYNEWRKAVFERDDYTCQSCGQHGGILNAHHIKPFSQYPNDRLDINNGITLCKECHRLLHRGELVIDWR